MRVISTAILGLLLALVGYAQPASDWSSAAPEIVVESLRKEAQLCEQLFLQVNEQNRLRKFDRRFVAAPTPEATFEFAKMYFDSLTAAAWAFKNLPNNPLTVTEILPETFFRTAELAAARLRRPTEAQAMAQVRMQFFPVDVAQHGGGCTCGKCREEEKQAPQD